MSFIRKIVGFIYGLGISEKFEGRNEMTGLLNVMCFINVICAFSFFVYSLFHIQDHLYQFILIIFGLAYLVIILLNHFEKIDTARLYFSIFIPLLSVIIMFLIGGYFGQSVIVFTTLIITSMNFEDKKKLRNFLLSYSVIIFSAASIYLNFASPIFGVRDYFFDEIVVLLLSIGWIYAVFYVYEKRNKIFIQTLKKKNQELEEKTLDLERFTTTTSHDLKSPLLNISNFLKVMDDDIEKKDYSKLLDYLGYTKSCAYRMRELIEGVLEVSTNGNDRVVNSSKVDFNKLLKEVLSTNQAEIRQKKAVVTSEVLPSYICNPADLIIIFQNLILNGIKYNNSDKPKIVINTKQFQNHFIIQFTDNGIGIDEKYHDEIFEYFKRLHNHSTYPGTGLGLGLSKKIVEKYHGQISVESVVGAYTSFKVILPNDWQAINEYQENDNSVLLEKSWSVSGVTRS